MSETSIFNKQFRFFSIPSHFFHFLFFFLLSRPLYFSYFLNLLSFLSPLFISTSLMFFFSSQFPHDSKIPEEIEKFCLLEVLEPYEMLFQTREETLYRGEDCEFDVPEVEVKVDFEESVEKILDVEHLTEELKESKLEERQEIRVSWIQIENEKRKELRKLRRESSISSRSESKPWMNFSGDYDSERRYGSMREEKEWGKTLASKMMEDRNDSSEGTEGMDSLWETYEKIESKKLQKNNGKSKRGKKIEDEDEDENGDGKLCCLQALKFSSKKMNLLKMSRVLKGFGFFRKRSFIR